LRVNFLAEKLDHEGNRNVTVIAYGCAGRAAPARRAEISHRLGNRRRDPELT